MTDTPETDAMEYFDAMCDPERVVEADFARKLERERNELILAVRGLKRAKGRFHTEQAAINLFNLLPRP